jgi:hypothetical protein
MIDRVAGLLQRADQPVGDDAIVFGKKYSHSSAIPPA